MVQFYQYINIYRGKNPIQLEKYPCCVESNNEHDRSTSNGWSLE